VTAHEAREGLAVVTDDDGEDEFRIGRFRPPGHRR
jgi:hypothetical protein